MTLPPFHSHYNTIKGGRQQNYTIVFVDFLQNHTLFEPYRSAAVLNLIPLFNKQARAEIASGDFVRHEDIDWE